MKRVYVVEYEDQENLSGNIHTAARKAVDDLKQYGTCSEPWPTQILYEGAELFTDCGRARAYMVLL